LARRVKLARALVEMVAKRVEGIGAGASASSRSKPAACRGLLAQAIGAIVGISTRLRSFIDVHSYSPFERSGSAGAVSQSRECDISARDQAS
jgi:hypothetical protein